MSTSWSEWIGAVWELLEDEDLNDQVPGPPFSLRECYDAGWAPEDVLQYVREVNSPQPDPHRTEFWQRIALYHSSKAPFRGETVVIHDMGCKIWIVESVPPTRFDGSPHPYAGEYVLLYIDAHEPVENFCGAPYTVSCLNFHFPIFHKTVADAMMWAHWADSFDEVSTYN